MMLGVLYIYIIVLDVFFGFTYNFVEWFLLLLEVVILVFIKYVFGVEGIGI